MLFVEIYSRIEQFARSLAQNHGLLSRSERERRFGNLRRTIVRTSASIVMDTLTSLALAVDARIGSRKAIPRKSPPTPF